MFVNYNITTYLIYQNLAVQNYYNFKTKVFSHVQIILFSLLRNDQFLMRTTKRFMSENSNSQTLATPLNN